MCLPEVITVDNGPEYTSKIIQKWAKKRGVHLDYITPGKANGKWLHREL